MTSEKEKKKIVDALRCCHCYEHKKCIECPYDWGEEDCADLESNAITLVEQLFEENERLHYTLQGVMHFVDKWIYGEPYYDVDDPDGKIAVNRAAEAREIALKAIEIVERERDASIEDYEKLKRERDAAVMDLKRVYDLFREAPEMCCFCKHCNVEPYEEPCKSCNPYMVETLKWEWRGVCAEDSGDDDE